MVGGRGGQVGPDLTVIARTMDRKKLVESILEPSREISPQYTTWTIETKSGKSLSGLLLGEEVNGDLRLGNNQGEIVFVPFKEIETRVPSKVSIMPEKLHETMSVTELSDLVSFLETLK
jgi:putative heme-binding domain-containing protein